MNVLIIDSDGCGLDFALRCMTYDHDVKWFIKPRNDGSRNRSGDGLVTKVKDWKPWARWADLIFLTGNDKYLIPLETLKHYGYPVFGPGIEGAKLEIERGHGMQVLKKHGIDAPPFKTFASLDDAERHVFKTEDRYVFKTLGDEEDKSLSYVSKSPADLINWIRRQKKLGKKLKGQCILQTFIPGIEMGVSGFFGPNGFLKEKWNINFEHKKLMSANFGPNTGEMGTVMQYVKKEKLADEMLKPLEDYLKGIGYRGDIDMNCIIDEKGKAWPLEFTCRPGWPAWMIMCSEHEGDPAKWMVDLLKGDDSLEVSYDSAVGLVIAQPNFPYTSNTNQAAVGIPILGITDENFDSLHLADVMLGKGFDMKDDRLVEKDMLVTSGEYVMVVTGMGKGVNWARKRAYRIADEISIPNQIVRDDIGEKLKEHLPELHKHGYATEIIY